MNEIPILVFTFCYAPLNTTGAFRIIRTVKYISQYGIKPVILTASNPGYPINKKLMGSVPKNAVIYRSPTRFPDHQYRKSVNIYTGKKSPLKKIILKLLVIIKDLIASPDIHIFWALGCVPSMLKIIRKHKIKAILVTGGPFSLIVASVLIRILTGVKVISEFRDPWGSYSLEGSFSFVRKFLNKHISQYCYKHSDALVSLTESHAEELRNDVRGTNIPVRLIPNGFDPADFTEQNEIDKDDSRLLIAYAGKMDVHDTKYNPVMLLKAWERFRATWQGKKPVLEIYWGLNDDTQKLIDQYSRDDIVTPGFVPRDQLLGKLQRADVLLHFYYPQTAEQARSSKMYEYAFMGIPMVSFSSHTGAAAELIRQLNIGFVCDNDDVQEMVNLLTKAASLDREEFRKGIRLDGIDQYNAIHLSGQMASLIKEVL